MSRSRPIKVLIADDQAIARAGLRAMLESDHIDVVGEAATGREAVLCVGKLQPDIVLMDINMPDMDGLEATEEIKRLYRRTIVVIVTGYEDMSYLQRAIMAGAGGYILKDVSKSALLNMVEAAIGGECIVSGSLLQQMLQQLAVPEISPLQEAPGLGLTPMERETLKLLSQGLTNKEIADQIHYSVGTVKNAVQGIIEKLGVSDRTQAAVYAVKHGLLPN